MKIDIRGLITTKLNDGAVPSKGTTICALKCCIPWRRRPWIVAVNISFANPGQIRLRTGQVDFLARGEKPVLAFKGQHSGHVG